MERTLQRDRLGNGCQSHNQRGDRCVPARLDVLLAHSSLLLCSAFAASVWLNDVFLSTVYNGSAEINSLFVFPENALIVGEDNVVTVLQDHMGNDEKPDEKSPRGIRGFELVGGNFTTWKVQGKFGGYMGYVIGS